MSDGRGGLLRFIRLRSATALVIANIIGVGIFTTTGFQAADLGHPGYIFLLWIVGGVLALCGALCYAELGAAMPEAGGEYVYLRETYGPVLGVMSAFVSLVAGFSAPIAAALKGFVAYAFHLVPNANLDFRIAGIVYWGDAAAIGLVWLLIAVHWRGAKGGIAFNDIVTLFKVTGIVGIILAAVAFGSGNVQNFTNVAPTYTQMASFDRFSAFGTSLIFVMFCFSGWNASAYVAAEMDDPQRNLPRSLLLGTSLVVVLYLALNAVYFYGAGVEGLAGKVEVGHAAARELFGPAGVSAVTVVLCISIFASASAMTIAGPRVYYAFGRDFPALKRLTRTNVETGAPTAALVLQGIITSAIILSGRVDQIQQYAGFTLTLFASLAVSCVIVLRIRHPNMARPFRTWGYPFTPLLFLAISVWTMVWAYRGRPWESSLALATVVAGGIVFYMIGRRGESNVSS